MTDTAFEEAVERYADMVFRLAYSYLRNRADAEDVMQETLLKLYTRADAEEVWPSPLLNHIGNPPSTPWSMSATG